MYPVVNEQEQTIRLLKGMQWVRTSHGSLFDRGSADSYYGRPMTPHYRTAAGAEITDLCPEEVQEYIDGYRWNEQFGDKKDWG